MKFVALISGGKDSFYNIHHCISQGHELVALANLYPRASDELDSFMFQTVGHNIIEKYSECLEIPLYRRVIEAGGSKNQHLEYEITENDEIEDLYELLKDVLVKHPNIQGVSCGAILSHYQRTRVENVCGRLGLTCLAYLWQRDQMQLMGEMCQNGLDARLIKVAAIGLNEKHLGKSITEMYPILINLNQKFQVHICGEGGEFETIVLDAPFFKKKLQITEKSIHSSSDDVSYLSFKVQSIAKSVVDYPILDRPPLLQEQFQEIYDDLKPEIVCESLQNVTISKQPTNLDHKVPEFELNHSIIKGGNSIYVNNLTCNIGTIEEQAKSVFSRLDQILNQHELKSKNIRQVKLLLADMNKFSDINSIYSQYFGNHYLPPSRVCIATTLPLGVHFSFSCEVMRNKDLNKEGIHIRSRSFWAPHNIGPYSQSILQRTDSGISASISGQIPLDPSSMELSSSDDPLFAACLSLQHLHSIADLVSVPKLSSVVCYITKSEYCNIASKVWNSYVEQTTHSINKDALIIVQVSQLPKGAYIEWGGFSTKRIVNMYEDEDEDDEYQESLVTVSFPEKVSLAAVTGNQFFCKLQDYDENWQADYTPVQKIWNSQAKEMKYGLVCFNN